MKFQCPCGNKFEFDVTPEMTRQPVKFVCPGCGQDYSQFVNGLIRQQFGIPAPTAAPMGVPLTDDAPASVSPPPPPPTPPAAPRMRVQAASTATATESAVEAAPAGVPCIKHRGEFAVEKCRVCGKSICPKCMEMFGYVCSPLCKGKAEANRMHIPVYKGQRSMVQKRMWRKVGLVGISGAALIIGIFGLWFWYAWFGCLPKPVFSVRFDKTSLSGAVVICGKKNDQVVFLHGPEVARYDMKAKKKIWTRDLVDRKKIAEQVEQDRLEMGKRNAKLGDQGITDVPRVPESEKLQKEMERAAEAALTLYVRGESVWVENEGKLTRYDWETGNPVKEVPVNEGFGGLICKGDELLMLNTDSAKPMLTRINLNTCDTRTEEFSEKVALEYAAVTGRAPPVRPSQLGGLPLNPNDPMRPMDPAKIAEQAQRMSGPAKMALPALLANTMNQQRLIAEMNAQDGRKTLSADDLEDLGSTPGMSMIPTKDGFVQFETKLLEKRVIERVAMKEAPKKSVLEGNVTAGRSMEVANEILNEMQRNRGGDRVKEDLSRYQVTIRGPGEESWTGEVEGPPSVYPLDTVKVLTANKLVIVFDKANKKLWQSALTYSVHGGLGALDEAHARYGRGPCVERKGTLYVSDEGVLTAFELASGNARWRLPSVGIAGLFFDQKDMIYVNTTTATSENLKYSKQIDVSQRVGDVVMKVDSRNGKILWSSSPGGMLNQVFGDYLLCVQHNRPKDDEEDDGGMGLGIGSAQPYLRIRRLSPGSGKVVWEYHQDRAPVDIQFDKNIIRCVWKKEVQVLKIPSWW